MAEWFTSGRFVYLVFAFVAIEAAVLAWTWRTRRVGLPLADLLPNLAAGLLVFAALERVASGAHWAWVAGFAAASYPAHLWDLWRRHKASSTFPWRSPG
ncbi:MAG: hypothetical protein KC933_30860 [Myxococcales bacterium]|nr:hypothetical protein [Myxococcales bacterium]